MRPAVEQRCRAGNGHEYMRWQQQPGTAHLPQLLLTQLLLALGGRRRGLRRCRHRPQLGRRRCRRRRCCTLGRWRLRLVLHAPLALLWARHVFRVAAVAALTLLRRGRAASGGVSECGWQGTTVRHAGEHGGMGAHAGSRAPHLAVGSQRAVQGREGNAQGAGRAPPSPCSALLRIVLHLNEREGQRAQCERWCATQQEVQQAGPQAGSTCTPATPAPLCAPVTCCCVTGCCRSALQALAGLPGAKECRRRRLLLLLVGLHGQPLQAPRVEQPLAWRAELPPPVWWLLLLLWPPQSLQ